MAIVITYRELRSPKNEGVCIVGSDRQARETLERLGREGYEVTRITPPIRHIPSGKTPAPEK
jgi:hypothetical protein